ncbi:MAG: hypothetical protein IV090_17805 [Candidatus Sericytochromatia bacterium]|nr:hypothetical protein [Candidatus Sericytochromatia bacterium]
MKTKISPRFLMVAGLIELMVGLVLCLIVGTQVSWVSAVMLAAGFFVSANILFFFAMKRA